MESANTAQDHVVPDVGLSTKIKYTLNFTGSPAINQIVTVALATAVYTVLSWMTLTLLPSPLFGVGSIFIPLGLGLAFCLWFGGWGFLIVYIGNMVGANLLTGIPLQLALLGGLADVIQLGIPILLYRLLAPKFGLNAIGKDTFTFKGFSFLAIISLLNVVGGALGVYVIVLSGFATMEQYLFGWLLWSISNIVVMLVTAPIILTTLGPIVERYGLTVRNFFS